jgi:hypothetical protein
VCKNKTLLLTSYSPFCVPAKVIKLVGFKNGGRVNPTNLIIFAGTKMVNLIASSGL